MHCECTVAQRNSNGYPIFDFPRVITSDLSADAGVSHGYAMTDAFGPNSGGFLDAVVSNGSDLFLMENEACTFVFMCFNVQFSKL